MLDYKLYMHRTLTLLYFHTKFISYFLAYMLAELYISGSLRIFGLPDWVQHVHCTSWFE
jgi:hypothetical protein